MVLSSSACVWPDLRHRSSASLQCQFFSTPVLACELIHSHLTFPEVLMTYQFLLLQIQQRMANCFPLRTHGFLSICSGDKFLRTAEANCILFIPLTSGSFRNDYVVSLAKYHTPCKSVCHNHPSKRLEF